MAQLSNFDDLHFYKDEDLKVKVEDDHVDLGIVDAGDVKQYTFWIKNDSPALLTHIQFQVEHNEVYLIDFPTEMQPHSVDKLILEYRPSVTLREGLQTRILLKFRALFG